ncbi:MAG TPA: hypothetical protein VM597_37115 [Gemmataceae bacterium]|nr:hypothetical protein [Gemmataceae bacterium]
MVGVRVVRLALAAALIAAPFGCGDKAPAKADPNELAKEKVSAMKRLAEVMARDPNGPDVFEAIEGFRNVSMDPTQHPAEVREILDIYKRDIEGKYKGENATQVHLEIMAFKQAAGIK